MKLEPDKFVQYLNRPNTNDNIRPKTSGNISGLNKRSIEFTKKHSVQEKLVSF